MSVQRHYSNSQFNDIFSSVRERLYVEQLADRMRHGRLKSVRSAHYTGTDGRKVRAS